MTNQDISITFDFDNCLTRIPVQEYAAFLIKEGYDVWVVTARFDDLHLHLYPNNPTNADLYLVLEKINLPKHKVRFMNMQWKADYLAQTKVVWHLDDCFEELLQIKNSKIPTLGINVLVSSWKAKCQRLIKNKKAEL